MVTRLGSVELSIGDELMGKGIESPEGVIACVHERALVEREVARLSRRGRRLAASILGRLVEIEAEWGADVAEAVVEGVIDTLRERRRVLS